MISIDSMVSIQSIIQKLHDRQVEFARADLSNPKGTEAFHFGVASGRFKAYEQMLEDINSMLEEDKEIERKKG